MINIQPYLDSEYIKKTHYSDRTKYKDLEDVENGYTIVRYNKSAIDMKDFDNATTLGNLRSVIFSKENKLVCYSPPKSIQWEDFQNSEHYTSCVPIIEEYIEGTMINMFWDEYAQAWEFATKNTIGCKKSFLYTDFFQHPSIPPKTFEDMFLEAYYYNALHYIQFDKTKCYSFVLQHPENRIVSYVSEPRIYLIACYKIENNNIIVDDLSDIKYQIINLVNEKKYPNVIRFPIKYEYSTNVEDFANHPDYNVMGIVIKNPKTGYYSKIRNNTYMNIKKMIGNSPSLLYRYVKLLKDDLINEYIIMLESYYRHIYMLKTDINIYFTKDKKHHVNMVYHLKQLHKKYRAEKSEGGDSYLKVNVNEYVNNMDIDNLYYALLQYHHFD
jgi:hypothetical protein